MIARKIKVFGEIVLVITLMLLKELAHNKVKNIIQEKRHTTEFFLATFLFAI